MKKYIKYACLCDMTFYFLSINIHTVAGIESVEWKNPKDIRPSLLKGQWILNPNKFEVKILTQKVFNVLREKLSKLTEDYLITHKILNHHRRSMNPMQQCWISNQFNFDLTWSQWQFAYKVSMKVRICEVK